MKESNCAHTDQHVPSLMNGLDYYKLTMGQLIQARHPEAEVTFSLRNRSTQPLSRYVLRHHLEERLEMIRERGVDTEAITYLQSLSGSDAQLRFSSDYLEHLETLTLPHVDIQTNPQTGDFDIKTQGDWPSVSLWETVVMSELNELYYTGKIAAEDLSLEAVYSEGDRRLSDKIATLKRRPDIRFADFGTRRRFSAGWHDHVVGRLASELPDALIGTSNPDLARKYTLEPIGTYAHEMPMVYAALRDKNDDNPLTGQDDLLQDWQKFYRGDLSVALTDTFTSEAFFAAFDEEAAHQWQGFRHDSGDPFSFGENVLQLYKTHGIDARTKTIVFSDGLTTESILQLADHFGAKINVLFGWGTTLTNDLGLKANNFVMKATKVDGVPTVKLSDVAGKHTGPADQIARYVDLSNQQAQGIYV